MSKSVYVAKVPSKINLSLEIVGRAGNLHTLKMLVCPYDGFFDIVRFYPNGTAEANGKTSYEPYCTVEAEGAGEYYRKEANFDRDRFLKFFEPKVREIALKLGVSGRLVVEKGVPLGAGLGGSTASIVGALKTMCRYAEDLGKSTALDDGFLLKLGSDVPCMTYGGACIVSGAGEAVKPVELPEDIGGFQVAIAEGGSDTKACYAKYDELAKDADTSQDLSGSGCTVPTEICNERINLYKNDLTMPACVLNKNIQNLISTLKTKYDCVFLSGSGSAVVYKNNKL